MKSQDRAVIRRVYRQALGNLDEETNRELVVLAEAAVGLRNQAIEQCRKWLEMEKDNPAKKAITAFSLNYWLSALRSDAAPLTEGVSVADLLTSFARQVLVTVAGSWSSFFELKKRGDRVARPPRPSTWPCPVTLAWRAEDSRVSREQVEVSGRHGRKLRFPIPPYLQGKVEGKKVVYVCAYRDWQAKWWLALTAAGPAPELRPADRFLAVDVGAGNIALATFEGKIALVPARRPDRWARTRVPTIEKRQAGRTKGSRGYRRLAEARRELLGRSGRQEKDFQRKFACALVAEADVVIVGTAPVRLGLAQSPSGQPKQHYGAQNTGYLARLVQLIEIEAAEKGAQVVKLTDPIRQGPLEEPASKFAAAVKLLRQGMRQQQKEPPADFKEVRWRFKQ